ncbi:MCE family protein [Gordonia amarae]|uniref:Mce family protein n=2 Tax=Gordonia amarae TaxID=36821 RepID=G7GQQ5_9ACTN|nr:MlaD family protein [Gordonia amarae]MCS3877651.1 virulence factor Mce-like protein [Gordonia amarae]QHN16363.1 MCE family protein [Gordonia amarae]QHN20932.1 MCE family protein [Gordonia amarae]QHN29783.1 MCE family protein [Gordonia amarae]QHN38558.1 MCE family protein [Gordonia amarae]
MAVRPNKKLTGSVSTALCVCAVIAALITVFAGRGINPANTLPRLTSSSDSRDLYVDFVSVVNLPLGARVLSRGSQIGSLDSIELVPDAARLKLHIDKTAKVPVGTKAELRQSTLLGDIYIALTPPDGGTTTASYLRAGDVIGLRDTDPGPQIEDIITNVADFMAGGSIMRVQDALRKVNKSVDVKDMDLRRASRITAYDVEDLSRSTAELDFMIDSLAKATTEMAADPRALAYSMGPDGRQGLDAVFGAVNEGFKLVAGSSRLAFGLNWLTPRLAQLNPYMEQLIPLLRTYSKKSTQFNGNSGRLIGLAQNKIGPFLTDGAIDVEKITVGSGGNQTDVTRSVTSVLRMIGALK